ncbi:MAG: MerR family transcriptional regulator [Ktedonobacteraceae bacterium]
MDNQHFSSIEEYLQSEESQQRILQKIQRSRLEATVTTSHAAQLFGFTENQLRDWETRGLLSPSRSMREGKPGHRRYTIAELDKLAIISDLLNSGYSIGEISAHIDVIGRSGAQAYAQQRSANSVQESAVAAGYEYRTEATQPEPGIDDRAENQYKQLFWRFFVSQVLRIALLILSEQAPPNRNVGLVLPLRKKTGAAALSTDTLPQVGESLVGWLGRSRSAYTFLTRAPSLGSPNYYQVLALQEMQENRPEGAPPKDRTLIIIDKRDITLTLNADVVQALQRLLALLYESEREWYPTFEVGPRDWVQSVADFSSGTSRTDPILPELANSIIRLGGQTQTGKDRWRFCCVMLPTMTYLSLQQRSLVVRAQSRNSPHKVGETSVSPGDPFLSLSIRAFQSGQSVYLRHVSAKNATIGDREVEEPIGSALAMPVGAEHGQPVAVLYIVADEADAFCVEDERVLRSIGRIIEEVLLTYQTRMRVGEHLESLIRHPSIGDAFFADFASENDFRSTLEEVLLEVKARPGVESTRADLQPGSSRELSNRSNSDEETEALSFVAIDVDHQGHLAIRYGDHVMRNLYRAISQRALAQLTAFTGADYKLYRILGGRLYILLKNTSLKQAQALARKLSQDLRGQYLIDPLLASPGQPILPASTLAIPDITVHIGVVSYLHRKLEELFQQEQYKGAGAEVEVGAEIVYALNVALSMGTLGTGLIISWDRKENKFQAIEGR